MLGGCKLGCDRLVFRGCCFAVRLRWWHCAEEKARTPGMSVAVAWELVLNPKIRRDPSEKSSNAGHFFGLTQLGTETALGRQVKEDKSTT